MRIMTSPLVLTYMSRMWRLGPENMIPAMCAHFQTVAGAEPAHVHGMAI
jgi:hypothetical protein